MLTVRVAWFGTDWILTFLVWCYLFYLFVEIPLFLCLFGLFVLCRWLLALFCVVGWRLLVGVDMPALIVWCRFVFS